jgi:hypothetical protein
VLEPWFLEVAGKITVLAEQRQPLLVGPCNTVGVERDFDLEKIAVDDAPDARPAKMDHHRRPRPARQRVIPQATIAAAPTEAPTKNVISPAMTCSLTSTISCERPVSPQPRALGRARLRNRNELYDAGAVETSYASTPFEP